MKTFLNRIAAVFRRRKIDADMSEEMRLHLEQRTRENLAAGMTPDAAHCAAQRKFGGVEQAKELARAQRGGVWLEQLGKDVRHGVRLLVRAPGFTLAAVASLALGIGANSAMFSVVHAVLLRPLPYPASERLVTLWSESRREGATLQPTNFVNVVDWSAATRTLQEVAAFDPISAIVRAGEARRAGALRATPNLAGLLGAPLQLGRWFTAEEAIRGDLVVVISHTAWQQHHGGAPDILGRRIEIDGKPTVIIGVLREDFRFLDRETELWLPQAPGVAGTAGQTVRGPGSWRALARLAPGATLAEAQAEMSSIGAALEREHPATNAALGVRVLPLADYLIGRDLRRTLGLLLAAVSAVLLIACSNVGNLLLARGLARQREFALRLSLGATRARLVTQLLVENLVLGLVATILGLALAWPAIAAVRAFAPPGIPRLEELALDLRVFGAAAGVSLLCAMVFGLMPALETTRRAPLEAMRDGARGSSEGARGRRVRGALVVAEFALAVVLLAGAGGLVRSLIQLLAVDPGFQMENVLVMGTRISASRPPRDAVPFAAAVVERVGALPGVTAVALSEEILLGERGDQSLIGSSAGPEGTTTTRAPLGNDAVTPDYFRALGVALRDGRLFTAQDGPEAPPVAIVSEALARRLWPNERAVGQRLQIGDPAAPRLEVVGVVGDQRRQRLDRAPLAQVFRPLAQRPSRSLNVIVRTAADPAAAAAGVRSAVRAVDPTVPVENVTTLRSEMDRRLAPRRFQTGLLALFAAMAFVLAGVGIFGLMHYSVVRRTHEIGIRAALGASGAQILRAVLGEGIALALLGVALGLGGAVALLRGFSALLYEVAPTDLVTLGAAAGALAALAAAACFLPARRASRVDPMVALRAE